MEKASVWVHILAFQFLMFFAKESLATQCYQCVADGASTFCNDPFNPNQYGVIKCEDKTCYKGTSYIAGIQITARNCTNYVIEAPYCEDVIMSGLNVRRCFCNKDLCNKSSKFGSFTGLLLFLLIACLALLLKLQ